MKKRITSGLLLLVALLGAACSSGNNDTDTVSQAPIASPEAGAAEDEVETTHTEAAAVAQEAQNGPGQGSLPTADEVAEAIYRVLWSDVGAPESITDQQMRCIGNAAAFTLGEERIVELGIDGPSLEAAYAESGSFLLGDRFGIDQDEIDEVVEEVATCADWRRLFVEGLQGDGESPEMAACFAAEMSDLSVNSLVGSILISPERPLGTLGTDSERAGQEMARLFDICLDLRSVIYNALVNGSGVSEQSAQCVVDNMSDELVERYLLVASDEDEEDELMEVVSELLDIQNQCLTPEELELMGTTEFEAPEFAPPDDFGSGPCPPTDGSGTTVLDFDGPQPMCLDATKQYTAVFDTTAGEMRIALDTANTPVTANNFAVLAQHHYYDDTLLFRTDPSIGIIQGGAPHTNSPSDPGPGYTIPDEGSGFTYEPGQIVMARTAAPNSASAQFFFAVNENTARLNNQGTYVVFGQMDDASLAVAEAILASHVDQPDNPLGGGPEPPVFVNSVTIEESG